MCSEDTPGGRPSATLEVGEPRWFPTGPPPSGSGMAGARLASRPAKPASGRDTSCTGQRRRRWSSPGNSHRVIDVDEAPLEAEPLREALGQRLDAEALGRVVPRGDQMDAELAGGRRARLLGLAGEQRVVALVGGLDQIRGRAAGRDRDPTDLVLAPARARAACDPRPPRRSRSAARGRRSRSRSRARCCRRGLPAWRRSASRAARCCRVSGARRARGGRRAATRSRGRAPRACRAAARRRRAARSARTGRGGRSPSPRPARRRSRTAPASTRRRTRSSSPPPRRRPACPGARTRGSARPRAARSRTRRSRPSSPSRESTGVKWGNRGVPPRLSGCPDLNWGPLRPERSALPGCATPRAGEGYRRRARGTMVPAPAPPSALGTAHSSLASRPARPASGRDSRRTGHRPASPHILAPC